MYLNVEFLSLEEDIIYLTETYDVFKFFTLLVYNKI